MSVSHHCILTRYSEDENVLILDISKQFGLALQIEYPYLGG